MTLIGQTGWRFLFLSDVERWRLFWEPSTPSTEKAIRSLARRLLRGQCGLRATLLYRMSHALHEVRVPFLPGALSRLNLVLHGLDIPSSVTIGPGLYIPHPVGTVVMARSAIGSNLTLISGITIGMRNTQEFPLIGSNVFVGAGARILGDVVIGDNVNIGANAVVVKSVPSGMTAVGVPAHILPTKNAASGE